MNEPLALRRVVIGAVPLYPLTLLGGGDSRSSGFVFWMYPMTLAPWVLQVSLQGLLSGNCERDAL
jgi:hypothetical protein